MQLPCSEFPPPPCTVVGLVARGTPAEDKSIISLIRRITVCAAISDTKPFPSKGAAQRVVTSGALPPCSQRYSAISNKIARKDILSDESLQQGRNRSRELNFSPL